MKSSFNNLTTHLAALALVWVTAIGFTSRVSAQTPATPAKAATFQKAGEAFKNVTTSTLKDISVADFIGSMGVMAAALGYDCADCHPAAGSDKVDWVFDTPKKKTARKMVEMVAAINKGNFNGAQSVTCWTCHHGMDRPATTIALDTLYGTPNPEHTDIVAAGQGVPTAAQILDKYIAAVGGAQKLAGLTSFIATGTSEGYEGIGGGGAFSIFAKAPDMRTTQIVFKDHPERGDSTRIYNGKEGYMKSPRGLMGEYELSGSELEGARLDAVTSFPGQIKTALTNWRSGQPDTVGDKDVYVVQGNGAGGPRSFLATLYFDQKTGLLVRMVRYSSSPIGRVPTQVDYSDYRDVNGIKFPFEYTFSWLDGKDVFKIKEVKTNMPVDSAKFAKP